jgi:hypothetical protein
MLDTHSAVIASVSEAIQRSTLYNPCFNKASFWIASLTLVGDGRTGGATRQPEVQAAKECSNACHTLRRHPRA